jgi:hypothetical protein
VPLTRVLGGSDFYAVVRRSDSVPGVLPSFEQGGSDLFSGTGTRRDPKPSGSQKKTQGSSGVPSEMKRVVGVVRYGVQPVVQVSQRSGARSRDD